jgi:tRNA U-34 5-methylaminomethyl-2-thiouridine biosynthesis protein MnmC
MKQKVYEYIVVGAGIGGCSVAYELSQHSNDILLIDKLPNVAKGASGAAGAFLSPLLGKPNDFKDLVTKALKYSIRLYKEKFPISIDNCGTTRIPKNEKDREKFKTYEPYMDFAYSVDNDGYYFKVGTVINSFAICKMLSGMANLSFKKSVKTKFDYEVKSISYDGEYWTLNDELKSKKLILTTGHEMELLDEKYINIKPVWGQRIDIETSTNLDRNYHKACSVSKSFATSAGKYKVSIGATHHRDKKEIQNSESNTEELLKKASDIVELKDIKVTKKFFGARASSFDYFPVVGEIIDSKKTLEEFPYLVNGTHVNTQRFTRYENLYILNGVGGRGFVLAPYLAKQLVENIVNNKPIDENIKCDRLFNRYVKRIKKYE